MELLNQEVMYLVKVPVTEEMKQLAKYILPSLVEVREEIERLQI